MRRRGGTIVTSCLRAATHRQVAIMWSKFTIRILKGSNSTCLKMKQEATGREKHNMTDNLPEKNKSDILIYQSEDGQTRIDVQLIDETVWLTQKLMSKLFQVGVNTINYHIKELFKEKELTPEATIRKFRIVPKEV